MDGKTDRTILRLYVFTVLLSLLWIGLIILAPLLHRQGHPPGSLLYAAFAPTCHQIPSHCFFMAGFPLAVCARCLGIYVGFLTGLFHYSLLRGLSGVRLPKTRTLLLLTVPIAVDAAANIIRLGYSPLWLRFATGWIWGQILPYYWMTGLALFFRSVQKKRRERRF
ncbi:MAG: DUF2085 domain-containing protein [Acidobacteria bacterium]|nr:DUF2085 domain-containing protein [Acidobacteriota bacterium]MBU1337536.1 DUF2085 domain-containing protein [Acidobacteriota bacterium]MBU1474523.1 DUF2085 domain-containing protein [Acidobacteriota bacterium]MBU4330825.1 DUF2085 domain-containing protein [Acidobacteriota bacterium]